MPRYAVDVPEGVPEDISVTCLDHDVTDTFPRACRRIAFHCPDCGLEVEIALHDAEDWLAWDERC